MERSTKLKALLEKIEVATKAANYLNVPVSGGSDSALVLWLLKQIKPGRVRALYSSTDCVVEYDPLRCKEWFIKTISEQNIKYFYVSKSEGEVMRWARFQQYSLGLRAPDKEQGWLVGSRNKTEDLLGTYSLASRVATFLPIVGLWKSEVLELCKEVGVPEEIITSSRKADPDCGRPAEMAEIGIEAIDKWLKTGSSQDLTEQQNHYLCDLLKSNMWKENLPVRIE